MARAEELDMSKEPARKLCTEVPHKKTPYDYCDNGKGEGDDHTLLRVKLHNVL